jgi:hypothetical protein
MKISNESINDFEKLSVRALLHIFVDVTDELKKRGIIRSNNIPTGDYAERIACEAFGLEQMAGSFAGYNAKSLSGRN